MRMLDPGGTGGGSGGGAEEEAAEELERRDPGSGDGQEIDPGEITDIVEEDTSGGGGTGSSGQSGGSDSTGGGSSDPLDALPGGVSDVVDDVPDSEADTEPTDSDSSTNGGSSGDEPQPEPDPDTSTSGGESMSQDEAIQAEATRAVAQDTPFGTVESTANDQQAREEIAEAAGVNESDIAGFQRTDEGVRPILTDEARRRRFRQLDEEEQFQRVADQTDGVDPSDISDVTIGEGGVEVSLREEAVENAARERFEAARQGSRLPSDGGLLADGDADQVTTSAMQRFDPEDFVVDVGDGEVSIGLSEEARRADVRSRTADAAGDRFEEDDVALVETEEGLQGRIPRAAVEQSLRTELSAEADVDPEDIVVERSGDEFTARVDERGVADALEVDFRPERLLDPDNEAPVVEAETDREALENTAGPLGGLVAAGGVGVAIPEPATSAGGAIIAGGALAAGAAIEVARRNAQQDNPTQMIRTSAPASQGEVGLGSGILATEIGLGSGVSNSELQVGRGTSQTELGLGAGPTETTVGVGTGTTGSELDVTGGSGGETASRRTGDSVVPEDFPLAGRDFPADPSRDRAQEQTTPEDVIDGVDVAPATQIGEERPAEETDQIQRIRERRQQRQRNRELQEILEGPGEVTLGEEVGRSFRRRRGFPTGAEAVVGLATPEPEVSAERAAEQSVALQQMATGAAPPTESPPVTGALETTAQQQGISTEAALALDQRQGQATALELGQGLELGQETIQAQETAVLQEPATGTIVQTESVFPEEGAVAGLGGNNGKRKRPRPELDFSGSDVEGDFGGGETFTETFEFGIAAPEEVLADDVPGGDPGAGLGEDLEL